MSDNCCPTCGQPLPPIDKDDPDALLRLLKASDKRREVYRGSGGRWYVTYGGGIWPKRSVLELMARGEIRPKYNDPFVEVFHVGRTIDNQATLAARQRGTISRTELVYVDALT
jgi:hypothetical protein